MRVGVWGIGGVGEGIACRLATTPFVSQIALINRTYELAVGRAVDITHGLAFAPSCWSVRAISEKNVARHLDEIDLLVLAHGKGVPRGGKRSEAYAENRKIFRETVLPSIVGFRGIVLVVSNPVDLMARLLVTEAALPWARVIGLGTVVETARLRASIASNATPARAPHEVWAFVIGTHDEDCVCAPLEHVAQSLRVSTDMLAISRDEVVQAASRVKDRGPEVKKMGTLHPIVEGAVSVIATIATDSRRTWTVSVLDPETPDGLFYSVPCTLGRSGVLLRHTELLDPAPTRALLDVSLTKLREVLAEAGD